MSAFPRQPLEADTGVANEASAFRQMCDLEGALDTVRGILTAIDLLADTLNSVDEVHAGAMHCLALLGLERLAKSEKVRSQLFRKLHPQREHFEQVGWPDADPPGA